MRKIQLNKNTKQGNEKKTVLNIIAKKQGKKKKQRNGKKVKSQACNTCKSYFFGWVS